MSLGIASSGWKNLYMTSGIYLDSGGSTSHLSGNPGTNKVRLYARTDGTAELWVEDEAGNTTQLSPHDPDSGEWYFRSIHKPTRKEKIFRMEKLIRAVERLTGESFIEEYDFYE